jgi:hypothetical protein
MTGCPVQVGSGLRNGLSPIEEFRGAAGARKRPHAENEHTKRGGFEHRTEQRRQAADQPHPSAERRKRDRGYGRPCNEARELSEVATPAARTWQQSDHAARVGFDVALRVARRVPCCASFERRWIPARDHPCRSAGSADTNALPMTACATLEALHLLALDGCNDVFFHATVFCHTTPKGGFLPTSPRIHW